MRGRSTVAVIIPAYNEEHAIGRVLENIPSWADDIIVVDNGSTDKTAVIAYEHGARVIQEPRRGYGSACLAGMTALKHPDVVIFLDGDFSDHPEEMDLLVDPIIEENFDVVIGSRLRGLHEPGALTMQAQFGNWLACWLIRLFWNIQYTDLGPFRAIRFSTLNGLNMQDPNYGWTVEMQIKAAREKMRIREVPVRYRKRIGKSKVSGTIKGVIGAGIKILITILREAIKPRRFITKALYRKIIIFTRYPEPGKTKTRLIPSLGIEGAAALQRHMTEDTLASALQLKNHVPMSIQIRYEGGNKSLMENWLATNVSYYHQGSGDLGERMSRAFQESFQSGMERVVIIGTDIPDLEMALLKNAFDVLKDNDVVLGPAYDGGYYLIGFNSKGFLSDIFKNIAWGTNAVFNDTMSILKKNRRKVHLLSRWRDVDTVDDLKAFIKRNQNTAFKHSRTFSYLRKKARR